MKTLYRDANPRESIRERNAVTNANNYQFTSTGPYV